LTGKIIHVEIPAGENAKQLSTCAQIWQSMLDAKLDRKSLCVNLGGGVIGDMGGFCAATWKRGIDFIQVPTTLLSMTDASIGGKTGIDFQGIKNTIGIFQQPSAVFADPGFLQTLPERELRSGFAEVLKHAVIGNPALALEIKQSFLSTDMPLNLPWNTILPASIEVKVQIVQQDPLEKGLRMLLNFGHSIGHALESWYLETDTPLTHGEAIYIGMICEAYLEGRQSLLDQVLSLGQNIFPRINIPETAFSALWESMQQDKKNSSGKVRLALPDENPYSLKILEIENVDLQRSLRYYNALD
jgi:3-dehydroquinate synthase